MELLDPKADLTFKRVFADHPHLLIDLLNSVLPIDYPIKEIEYLPTELITSDPQDKLSIVDVKCVDQSGRKFIVEMQVAYISDLFKRLIYNASKVISKDLTRSQKFDQLNPVYMLCFLDSIMDKQTDVWFHHYAISHKVLSNRTMTGVDWFFIELPKWKKSINFNYRHKRDLWLTFLSDPEKLNKMYSTKEIEKFEELSEALDLINASKYTEAQIRGIEHYLDTMRYNNSLLEGTRRDTLNEVLAIMAEIKNGSALDKISLKYGVDISYVVQLKEEIGGAGKG